MMSMRFLAFSTSGSFVRFGSAIDMALSVTHVCDALLMQYVTATQVVIAALNRITALYMYQMPHLNKCPRPVAMKQLEMVIVVRASQ